MLHHFVGCSFFTFINLALKIDQPHSTPPFLERFLSSHFLLQAQILEKPFPPTMTIPFF